MGAYMNELLMSIKQAIRPLIPDSVMARYRVRQHSRAMRTNVDLFVSSDREARKWMALTPDTYRVVTGIRRGGQGAIFVALGENDDGLSDLIGFDGIEVAVRGDTLRPTMRGRRVSEPVVVPRSIVSVTEALDEIGGISDNSVDLVRAYQRLSDAGRHIGLVPSVVERLSHVARTSVDGPAAVVFAAVPLHDIGGGSRAAQLAFEMLRTGIHVTYVSLYPSAEGIDLGLRYIHPMLEQYRIEALPLSGLLENVRSGTVILEAPSEPFFAPASALKDRGWGVVYDIIDDWADPSLGGDWYTPDVEQAFIDLADGVVASAPDLVRHGKALGAEPVLVPNAVNTELFGPVAAEIPTDLPAGRLIGYHGSLYGEWFDWDALAAVAEAFPADTVVIIGDDRYKRSMPSNVSFLGLKPQAELPGYVQRFAVGLVPFELSDMTHAVSPLKVYEYLASGVAVAAPPLRSLQGLDGVYTDVDLVKAVTRAMDAPDPDREVALNQHSWRDRLERLFDTIGADMPPRIGAPVKTVRRVPVHYDRKDRWVRAE